MLTKIRFRTILFMAVLLLIIPMIMSADETDESSPFENQFLFLLKQVDSGVLNQENANEQIISLGKKYSVNEENIELAQKMMYEFANGKMTIANCQEQLKEQQRYTNIHQKKLGTQEGTQIQEQTQTTVRTPTKATVQGKRN